MGWSRPRDLHRYLTGTAVLLLTGSAQDWAAVTPGKGPTFRTLFKFYWTGSASPVPYLKLFPRDI